MLNHELICYSEDDYVFAELISDNKTNLLFTFSRKNIKNNYIYQLFLDKYLMNKNEELVNGEFTLSHNGNVLFKNYGFFRSNISYKMLFDNEREFEDAVIEEILKCGESLYD